MPQDLPNLTEHQIEIMKIIWDHPDVSVIEVAEMLSDRREVARNTVQTMLSRLSDKGWLRFRKVGNTYRYSATRSRKFMAKSMLNRLNTLVFEGSAEALISSLVDGEKLTPDEAKRIHQIIDRAETSRSNKHTRRS